MAYSVNETQLMESDREELSRPVLKKALQRALPRRLRKHDRVSRFFMALDNHAEASITWSVQRRKHKDCDDHRATLCAWELSGDEANGTAKVYAAQLFGPSAYLVIERLNVEDRRQRRKRKQTRKRNHVGKRTRRMLKNQQRRERQRLERQRQQAVMAEAKPTKQRKVRAVMSHKLEDVTPQFKKTRVFFEEAIDMIVYACRPAYVPRYTSRQVVARQLFRCLERTDYAFARIKCGDFSIALSVEEGRWRGVGLTPVRVWCTKNNRDPAYRRLRKWLRNKNQHLKPAEASVRRHLLFDLVVDLAA